MPGTGKLVLNWKTSTLDFQCHQILRLNLNCQEGTISQNNLRDRILKGLKIFPAGFRDCIKLHGVMLTRRLLAELNTLMLCRRGSCAASDSVKMALNCLFAINS